MLIAEILALMCLLFIGYQDLRYRAVYWICFPIVASLFLLIKTDKIGWYVSMQEAVFGLLFFALQFFLLWIYFSVKEKKRVALTSGYLGWGDVLFLVAVSFYFSPFNYIIFYVLSMVLVLIYAIITRLVQSKKHLEIPLAGLQALMLSILIILTFFYPNLIPYDDTWIYRL